MKLHFQIGGVSISVESDLPILDSTFHSKTDPFRISSPSQGSTNRIIYSHHFEQIPLPSLRNAEWVHTHVGRTQLRLDKLEYFLHLNEQNQLRDGGSNYVYDPEKNRFDFYHSQQVKDLYLKGSVDTISLLVSDQHILVYLLGTRGGFYLHSSALDLNGHGVVFAGHADAGKSTITRFLSNDGTILCDDRNIIKYEEDNWRVYGTWQHGELPDVSPGPAPLSGIFFLEQAGENKIIELTDKKIITKELLKCLVVSYTDRNWWQMVLDLVEKCVNENRFYSLRFKKDPAIRNLVTEFLDK